MPITYLDEEQPQGKITYLDKEQPQEPKTSIGESLGGAALAIPPIVAGGYAAYKLGKPLAGMGAQFGRGIANLPKVVNVNKSANFANQVRSAFIQAHTNKINEFGSSLEALVNKNLNKTVSLTEVVSNIVDNWGELSPTTKTAIRNTPILNQIIKVSKGKIQISGNPESISLKATQDILNHLNTKVPANIRVNNLDLLDTINEIKGSQLEAFPEMANVRATYKQFIEPYKQVKNYFKFNRVLNAIKNKFGGAEGQVAVEKILPPKTLKQMKGYRAGAKLAEIPGDIPFVGRFLRSFGGMLSITPMFTQALGMARQLEEAKKKGYFKIDNFGNIIPLSKEDLAI
jgi:hypothetical protein